MMNHRKARMGKSHDFGLPAVAGKGDADRTTDLVAFNKNFSEIMFSKTLDGFTKIRNKVIKKYGN